MSEDQSPPPLPTLGVPLEEFAIPFQLLDRWMQFSESQYLQVNLTRRDFDLLFSSIDKGLKAQAVFHNTLVLYSNGDAVGATQKMHESHALLVQAQNALRQLFTSIMAAAAPPK